MTSRLTADEQHSRPRQHTRSRRDRWLALAFLLVLAALIARAAHKSDGVLLRNQEFGRRFLAREDPYFDPAQGQRVHGPYPPSFVLVAAPLSLLPPLCARIVWALVQSAALIVSYSILRRWTRAWSPALTAETPWIFAAALLLASRFILRDMAGGGGNLIFATIALCALDQGWRARSVCAGALLALSLVLKPNLAPVLGFFLARRQSRTVLATLIVGTLLFFAPAVWFGAGRYVELSQRWASAVFAFARLADPGDPLGVPDGLPVADTSMNQCLRESVLRAVRAFDANRPTDGNRPADGHRPGEPNQPDDTQWRARTATRARTISLCASLALAATALAVTWRARSKRAEVLAALAFLPLCLLVSPISWKAHHAALLAPFFVLVACARERRRWGSLASFLVLVYALCDLASEEIVGSALKERFQELSLVTWIDVALLSVLLVLARRADHVQLA